MEIGTVQDQDHYVTAVEVQYRTSIQYTVKSIGTIQDQYTVYSIGPTLYLISPPTLSQDLGALHH